MGDERLARSLFDIQDKLDRADVSTEVKRGREAVSACLVGWDQSREILNGGLIIGWATERDVEEYARWLAKILVRGLGCVICRDFELALVIADRLLAVFPTAASYNILRAHALMFLNRPDEARTSYERFRHAEITFDTRGVDTIRSEFEQMREVGLAHPLMDEIGKWG
jgi:hypothetical protein